MSRLTLVGQRTTPSVVAFGEDGTRHVGDVAKRQVMTLFINCGLLWFLRCVLSLFPSNLKLYLGRSKSGKHAIRHKASNWQTLRR
jgi:hypothetical protein